MIMITFMVANKNFKKHFSINATKILFCLPFQGLGLTSQVSQSRFNPKSAQREDLGAVLKPNIEPKLDEYHLYFF